MKPKMPLTSLMLILLLLSGLAVAGIDYHLGTGQDGDLVVSRTTYTDGVRSSVTGDNPVGTKFIYIRDTAAFKAGNEVLIISSQKTGVGQYETKNITSISGTRLYLDRPLTYSYGVEDRKSTRLNSSHALISYAVFCLKKKKNKQQQQTKKQKKTNQ